MAVAQEKASEAGTEHLLFRIQSRHCAAYASAICHCVRQLRQTDSRTVHHHIRWHPNRDFIPIRHYTPSHFLHYVVHATKFRLALCFYAEFMLAAERQVEPGPTWSLQVQSGNYFLSPCVNIWIIRTSLYQLTVFLVVDTEYELVRNSHSAVRASCRLLQKHFTGSKLFINLQRVTGELLQDHASFLGWPFQTFPESHLSPFLI